MAKTKRKNKGSGGTSSTGGNNTNASSTTNGSWSHEKHSARIDARLATLTKKCRKKGQNLSDALQKGYKRTALAHDNVEKIDSKKLALVICKTKRQVDALRERLRCWDDVEEKKREMAEIQKEEEKKRKAEEEAAGIKTKKRGRLGPETWKLRGAARPAWEVYDFDTRYVDPHVQAHQQAKEKAQRIRNILSIYKGQFGRELKEDDDNNEDEHENDAAPPQPHCRRFLSLLMQLGSLNMEAKKYKAAREAFLECIDLDGTTNPVTNARCRLMRMYLEANRPASARRLWERLPSNDPSSWIRYSAALVEYVSWKLLEEEGSSKQNAELLLVQAIKANVYCAYHIAYHDTFESVVEYAEEIEDAEEGSLEEAIEYCASEQMGTWIGTEGAIDWMKKILHKIRNGLSMVVDGVEVISAKDLEWSDALAKKEEAFELELKAREKNRRVEEDYEEKKDQEGCDDDEEEGKEEAPDLLMYAGMFRTAMDMLEDAGEFLNTAVEDSDEENEKDEYNDDDEEEEEIQDAEKEEAAKPSDTSSTCSSHGSNSDGDDDDDDDSSGSDDS